MHRFESGDPFGSTTCDDIDNIDHNIDIGQHESAQETEETAAIRLDKLQNRIHNIERGRLTRYDSVMSQVSKIAETEEEIWVRRVQLCMNKLIMMDPGRKAHKANLYRYFHLWSLCLPLNQKCDELGKQLRERSAALETVRDCYHRDVLKVKLQLENIYDHQDNKAKRGELASVPSVDLRGFVRNAFHQPSGDMPSDQLQDLFVNGDTLKYTTAVEFPWEQGRKFKEQKLTETGYEYKLPHVEASMMDLHAPSRHKLLVRYCPDCIGLMTLVHAWNKAVEDGLSANVDNLQARGLRDLVHNLTDITRQQEMEINELKAQLALAQPKVTWVEARMHKQADADRIHALSEKVNQWRFIAEMCNAERDTVETNIRHTFNKKLDRARQDYDILLDQLNEKREECSYLNIEVENMAEVFSQHQAKELDHKNELAKLLSKVANQEQELDRCIRSRTQILKGIEAKDQYIIEIMDEHTERVDTMNKVISIRNSDNERLALDVDKITNQLTEASLAAMHARAKHQSDTQIIVESSLELQRDREVLLMKYEDLRSTYHRDFLNSSTGRRRRRRSTGISDDASLASMASENEVKKADIRRSLMLFPTKMRNSMASAIESVVSLNQSSRRYSSAGSVSAGNGSRRSSKQMLGVMPNMINEGEDEDDLSSVGNDGSSVAGDRRQSMRRTSRVSMASSRGRGAAASDSDATRSMVICSARAAGSATGTGLDDNAEEDEESDLSDGEMSMGEQLAREGELLDNIREGMEQLVSSVLPTMSQHDLYDRKYPLKTVVTAIIFLLRLRKGLMNRDYTSLGYYGLKIHVKKMQSRIDESKPTIDETPVLRYELEVKEKEMSEVKAALQAVNAVHQEEIKAAQKVNVKLSEAVQSSQATIIRERMISRMQRRHAEYLALHMSVFRARLHLMTHANAIRDEVPPGMIPPPEKRSSNDSIAVPNSSPSKPKKRITMSFGSKAYAADKKAKEAAALSDEEEENDIRRLPLYKVRKVFFHVLARLRKLKFDRPFRRANSMLLTAQHGKALALWMVREEEILASFVKDAQLELGEVERILKRMRQQCSEDRRKAEAFRALLGVDTPLSIGVSFVGEPPINVKHGAISKSSSGLGGNLTNPDILTPRVDIADVNKLNQFLGLDQSSLRILSAFRHREIRPEMDIFDTANPKAGKRDSGRSRSVLSRTQSSIPDANPPGRQTPVLTHAHTMGADTTPAVPSLSQSVEETKQSLVTLRQRLRRNGISGPAGVRPDDNHTKETKFISDLGRAAATEMRLTRTIEKLSARIDEVEDELTTGYAEQARLKAELDVVIEDHEFLRKQNGALKQAVTDSYRVCYEKSSDEVRKLGLDKLHFQQENMRSQATQVACVPCDLATLDPQLGPHIHKNPKLRAELLAKGTDSATGTLLGDSSGKLAADLMSPLELSQGMYVLSKQRLVSGANTCYIQGDLPSNDSPHFPPSNMYASGNTPVQGTMNETDKQAWRELMYRQNRLANANGIAKPQGIGKGRPLSAVQLTTPKQPTAFNLDAMGLNEEDAQAFYKELQGIGAISLDNASLEVRTAASRRRMHHDKHDATTDVNTDGVHVSAANQYLQYLGMAMPEQKQQGSTFSKMKAMPKSSSAMSGSSRLRALSASASSPLLGAASSPCDTFADDRQKGGNRIKVVVDLQQQKSGAVAQMASALQILHEVRENHVAQRTLDNRRSAQPFYKTDSDREQEQSWSVSKQGEELIMGVVGALHHGGGNVPTTVSQGNGPPSLVTRPASARPAIVLSPKVTQNTIPRLEADRLRQMDSELDIVDDEDIEDHNDGISTF